MEESDTTKYVIHAHISAEGVVERPDVVGAVFGQTEGLLGADLDLRELQKTGRIGRIEVNITSKYGKSSGNILIPSSLDKVETSILAAALETIDRVGPCISKISVTKIEDVRSSKRQQIIERAKHILTAMFDETVPESQELTEAVKSAVRVEEVTFIDNLPAGPDVLDSDAIIVVEGRADVLNLLRAGIKNAIAVEGTNVPQLVAELSKKKTVTVFTDSDRGGDLILKELLQVADVDYIARPPEGKSVEDLTQKEIIKALRSKVPVEQVVEVPQRRRNKQQQQQQEAARAEQNGKHDAQQREYQRPERPERERGETPRRKSLRRMEERPERREPPKEQEQQPEAKKPEPREAGEFAEIMKDLAGTLSAKLLDANKNVLQKVAVRDLANVLKETNGEVKSVVFDGVITQRMLDIAAEKNLEYLVGVKMGSIVKQPANVKVITTE
ncbi:DNA primase (bacterial type) [Methanocella conradii HZ254]|uniref:DNA primase DnaG n=1 Tax=Methanocella conradii (strain DSM 24694 / JCM 17849 / CGMCC 1.5162 / HZ254) TaxID=1041930 RepID=H8I583_METCZ|nr:DNA primase DnaG [Methanocella conradii]AFC99280.1 DNA primase (bacterial type) [Methanocella conradii HZ254]MDI6897718.1 DNA primase DnaG [Methanocella conradii]